jgi:hypothetical protein
MFNRDGKAAGNVLKSLDSLPLLQFATAGAPWHTLFDSNFPMKVASIPN